MLAKLAIVSLLFCLLGTSYGQINSRPDRTKVRNFYAFIADKGLISPFAHQCIDHTQKYMVQIKESPSIETLIDLIERLEDVVANTSEYSQFNSPDKVARMILQRFHMDSVDFNTVEQDPHVGNAARIDTEIIGKMAGVPDDYYFPDYVYTSDELCTMLFMFSHIFLNNTAESQVRGQSRFGRATYQFQRSQTNGHTPINSPYLDNNNQPQNRNNQDNVGPIQEKGIVSFRQDKKEAIAPAKVLMGIIAGLTDNAVLSGKTITSKITPSPMTTEVTLKDSVLAVTFGNLLGTASFYEFPNQVGVEQNLIFGVQGTWVNETCCTYYATEGVTNARALRKANRGSLAQIRGALDGYSIGKNLKTIQDVQTIRLSSILKSYYSFPHLSSTGSKLGLSYCDRRENRPNSQDINEIGTSYNEIYKYAFSMESSVFKGELLTSALDRAANGLQDFCNKRPSGGNYDTNSPCETPSDLIFVVDPKSDEMSKTAQLISEIVSKINKIGRYAGAVSVFVNSNSRNNIELPSGPGGWPLPALVWNSTNTGAAVCQLMPETSLAPQNSLGKYLHNVNQTIFNYKWWTRKSYAGVPSKNVILIDYGSLVMPTSGTDNDDFHTYRDALKWRNRDVKYLVVSPKQESFKDFVGESTDIVNHGQASAIATTFADKICKNPATLIYNGCFEKASQNFTYEGFITPGYHQNWAVYPEYFKVSSSMEFKIKALEGGIRYCYDRTYPTVKQEYCKELAENAEDSFKYWGPCSGHSVHTCSPLYITVWGKERTTPCKDVRCQSLDQIKFSIGHTGLYCNSAVRLASAFVLQMVCMVFIWMYSFKTV